jgi:hypothetical protein
MDRASRPAPGSQERTRTVTAWPGAKTSATADTKDSDTCEMWTRPSEEEPTSTKAP